MILRDYKSDDCNEICTWLTDEKSFYQWSAGRIGAFPMTAKDLDNYYLSEKKNKIIPLCAFDDKGNLVGQLIARYPDQKDKGNVRFGFIVVNPNQRGCGYGKQMLKLALDYAKSTLGARRVTLGVFDNNPRARHCYESVGFRPSGIIEIYRLALGDWDCIEMEYIIE